ncbi:glycosyl hydrolase family 28-related protein [Spirosoma sp. 48-14]|uniref:glycosyl hydrolase family 28-related protein n=1 Tax=Spirosoma sp. 48-14 TaxID=1895854 RepID=UPI0009656956|nr:glycosyl hydrolase family 28-related protein [Spirosoma sp. 48-14]OJW78844.1 MAG: hypothetical protein BGO59_10235 [Spirosoma sp. 48-14]
MAINVKDPQFGAVGNGSADDSAAIQKAVNYAKTLSANASAPYIATVYFPAGYYLIGTTINLTGATGIWLVGDGGSYLNTIILGITGSRPMFDFSGSSFSGCENFMFEPAGGNASSPSTIAVQFGRTNLGGLNCGIKKCYFQMSDTPSSNGGLGSIGLLNIRSEEFFIHECTIRANSPVVLSYSASLNYPGVNYSASSSFSPGLLSGTGSMGVVNIMGTSLQAVEKRQPALILNGTNSINFEGYLSRIVSAGGTNETAVLCTTATTNLKLHATVESFSRILQVISSGLENCDLDVVIANSLTPTTELIDITNCFVAGLKARIAQPVTTERNRTVLYHAPTNGGTQQAAGTLINCEIYCIAVPNNQFIISANLLKRATNVSLNTLQPFEKRNGRIRQLANTRVSAGVNGNVTAATILQFIEARLSTTSNNSGYYRIWVEGTMKAGGYGSGQAATFCFQAQIVINQKYDGTLSPPSVTIISLDESSDNPNYLFINGIIANLTFSGGIGSVTLTPRVSGSGTGEPVYFEGYSELQSDFFINEPIPIS